MGYLNRNLSIEIGKLHGWRGSMWERRYHHSIVDDDPAIQIERLRYILSQGVKEGLVFTPADWPGVHCAQALMDGTTLQGLWIDHTAIWAARNRGESFDPTLHTQKTEVRFSPLPCWAHLSPDQQRSRVRELVETIVEQTAAEHQRNDTEPLGRRAILGQSPHHRPEKAKWSPAPRIHAANRNARWALWRALQSVVVAYYDAAERLRSGTRDVIFPEGTFPPRRPYVPSTGDLKLGFA
jgi:hypothetical protein